MIKTNCWLHILKCHVNLVALLHCLPKASPFNPFYAVAMHSCWMPSQCVCVYVCMHMCVSICFFFLYLFPPPLANATRLLLSRTLEQFIFSASVNRSHTLLPFYPWHIGPAHNFTISQFQYGRDRFAVILFCAFCFFFFFFALAWAIYFCHHSGWQFNKRDCHANRA